MKHKLIVFDIDETLFTSIEPDEYKYVKVKYDYSLTHGGTDFRAYRRPYLKEFMKFCEKNFEYIGIWTNADEMWMAKFIQNLIPDTKLLFTYHREYSVRTMYNNRSVKTKPLRKIFEKYGHLGITPMNTFIVEDSPENCIHNIDNYIPVPEFDVVRNSNDIILPLLAAFIMELNPNKDIRLQLKNKKHSWRDDMLKKYIKTNDMRFLKF